jgi:hypothetical protein
MKKEKQNVWNQKVKSNWQEKDKKGFYKKI